MKPNTYMYSIECPNTDTIGISETINPTKKCNEYNIHNYINILNNYF